MAILVKTATPSSLQSKIRAAIDAQHVVTWEYDSDGDFTHSPPQWRNKAWLRPQILNGELRFGLLGQTGHVMTSEVYAIYHGRFIEMLLNHFDKDFMHATATAHKTSPDQFS